MTDVGEKLRFVPIGSLELFVLLFELLKQPNVFDGDYRLVGESFKQSDLFFGEGPNIAAVDGNRSDQ